AFATEMDLALRAIRLQARCLPGVHARLARQCLAGPANLAGPGGVRFYETVAAAVPHPVYPTPQARPGLSDSDLLRYAPEFFPAFRRRWAAMPRHALTQAGGPRPDWWPRPGQLGLPESLGATHELIPVHPLTARERAGRALGEAGLADDGPGP